MRFWLESGMDNAHGQKKGGIWALAGGKGGTGKSFLVSSIGTVLAQKDKDVTLVDFDLGGANLHSFLGIPRPEKTLTQFLESGTSLLDLAVPACVDNMALISGDIDSLASSSFTYAKRQKLFRHIAKLGSRYILFDLGAGCHSNVLDTFLLADKMIIVLVPEVTSVENVYHFIKNALYRKVLRTLRTHHGSRGLAELIWKKRAEHHVHNLREFLDYLGENFSPLKPLIEKELEEFSLYLVVNMVRETRDISIGGTVKSLLLKYLGLHVRYAGYIEYDDSVWRSVRDHRPHMLNPAPTRSAKQIETLTENLLWDRDISGEGNGG